MPLPPKGTNLRDAIVAVERLFSDYEATSSEKLSNHFKIAALRKMLPPEMRVHVNMQIRDNTTYEETVTEYEVAERRYNPLVQSVYDMEILTPVHMDCMCYVSGCNLHGGYNMMLSMVYLGRTLKLMQNGLRTTGIGYNTVKIRFMCM